MKAETQVKHLKISRDVIAVNILGIIVIGLFAGRRYRRDTVHPHFLLFL